MRCVIGYRRVVGRRLRRNPGVHQLQLSAMFELLAGAAVLHAPQVAHFQLEFVDGQMGNLERSIALRQRAGERVDSGLLHIQCHGT